MFIPDRFASPSGDDTTGSARAAGPRGSFVGTYSQGARQYVSKRHFSTRTLARYGRGFRGSLRYVALLLVLPTLVVQAATTTSAGAVLVAGFEIDGNAPDDARPASTGAPRRARPTDPVGNADTTNFGVGSKEFDHPTTWERKTGVAPTQDDISAVYFHDAIVEGDIWGFVGFRRSTTSGTTNFDVEFNKLPNAAGSDVRPGPLRRRRDGAFRAGRQQRLQADPGLVLDAGGELPTGAPGCIEVPGYTPRSGWCSGPSTRSPSPAPPVRAGTSPRAPSTSASLLEAGGIGDVTCAGGDFGTMNIRSFTGNANESALKDYINPVTIDVDDTCGELEIYKVDQFGNSIPGATFSISPNPSLADASPLVIATAGPTTPTTRPTATSSSTRPHPASTRSSRPPRLPATSSSSPSRPAPGPSR